MKQTLLFAVLTVALVSCAAPRPAAEPASPAQEAAPAPPPRFAAPPGDAREQTQGTAGESPAAAEKSSEAAEDMEAESAAPVSPAPGDRVESAEDYDLLTARYSQLEEALSSGAPRCDEAERLRELVCSLAERICDLVEDLPRSSSGHAQCLDGRQRCEDAKRRYSARCE